MADEQTHEGGGLLHKKVFGLPLPIVVGGAGLLIWFVLAHRAAGGAVAAPQASTPDLGGATGAGTAQSLQDQQAQEQLGYQSALDQLRLNAAGFQLSQQEAAFGGGQAIGKQGGHTVYSYGTGPVSKAWQQVLVGGQTMWEDIFHPGHIISEQQAQQLAPQDKGPYASGANKLTLGNVFSPIINNIVGGFQKAANAWISAQTGFPIGLPSVMPPVAVRPAGPSVPTTPGYTPPIAVASANRRYLG